MSAPAGAGPSVSDPNNFVGFGIGGSDLGTQQTAGLVGGVQGGCDYQVGSFVFGVQGMFDGASMKGNTTWQASPTFTNNGKIPWFGTLTGRVGVTFVPTAMFYAKAGVALLHHDYSRDRFGVALATGSSGGIGWTAGVGVEWIIFGTWSLWAEYNYIGIGRARCDLHPDGQAHCNCRGPASFPLHVPGKHQPVPGRLQLSLRRGTVLTRQRCPCKDITGRVRSRSAATPW